MLSMQSMRRSACRLKLAFFYGSFLCVVPFQSPSADTKVIVAEGSTETCHVRSIALNVAHTDAINDAHSECAALGPEWRFGKLKHAGYEQCQRCGSSDEFECKVTQATFECKRPDPKKKVNKESEAGNPSSTIKNAFGELEGNKPAPTATTPKGPFGALNELDDLNKKIKAQPVRILSPANNATTSSRIIDVSGDTQGYATNSVLNVQFNGASQQVLTSDTGSFDTKVALKSGRNEIKVCVREKCSTVEVNADIEKLSLMATLTWEAGSDLDLRVETPSGNTCNFKKQSTRGECTLDIDDTKGLRPENISVPLEAPAGEYRFTVINFSGKGGVSGRIQTYHNDKPFITRNFITSSRKGEVEATVVLTK
ncbi:hypothetical protein ACXPVS_07210 [Pseudomonas sp. Ma2-10]